MAIDCTNSISAARRFSSVYLTSIAATVDDSIHIRHLQRAPSISVGLQTTPCPHMSRVARRCVCQSKATKQPSKSARHKKPSSHYPMAPAMHPWPIPNCPTNAHAASAAVEASVLYQCRPRGTSIMSPTHVNTKMRGRRLGGEEPRPPPPPPWRVKSRTTGAPPLPGPSERARAAGAETLHRCCDYNASCPPPPVGQQERRHQRRQPPGLGRRQC